MTARDTVKRYFGKARSARQKIKERRNRKRQQYSRNFRENFETTRRTANTAQPASNDKNYGTLPTHGSKKRRRFF